MADRITDERLREIATSDPLVLAISAQMGEPSWADVRAIAAELLAARAEVQRLRSRVGWLDHLDTPEGRAMHATEAVRVENEQLRTDLREAIELIRLTCSGYESPEWKEQAAELLDRHKETP